MQGGGVSSTRGRNGTYETLSAVKGFNELLTARERRIASHEARVRGTFAVRG